MAEKTKEEKTAKTSPVTLNFSQKEFTEMTNNIEKDTLELVLKEMLEEQKNANKINTDLISAINQLTTKVNSFNEKLETQEIIAPPADTKPFQEIIKKGITQMQWVIAAQPKNVTRKLQFLLFPNRMLSSSIK